MIESTWLNWYAWTAEKSFCLAINHLLRGLFKILFEIIKIELIKFYYRESLKLMKYKRETYFQSTKFPLRGLITHGMMIPIETQKSFIEPQKVRDCSVKWGSMDAL